MLSGNTRLQKFHNSRLQQMGSSASKKKNADVQLQMSTLDKALTNLYF